MMQRSGADEDEPFKVYCDASFSPYGSHSFTGVCTMWCGAALLWRAVKQSMVAQSTAEAELLSMASGLQAGQAVQEVVQELGLLQGIGLQILGDNQAALALAKNGGAWRSRHYAVKAAALADCKNRLTSFSSSRLLPSSCSLIPSVPF